MKYVQDKRGEINSLFHSRSKHNKLKIVATVETREGLRNMTDQEKHNQPLRRNLSKVEYLMYDRKNLC